MKTFIFLRVDIFASHAVGGLVGSLLTGIFADTDVAASDGRTRIAGGWINHNWIQLAYQLASSSAIIAYSFFGSWIILSILDRIPGVGPLRASEEAEIEGLDFDQLADLYVLFLFRPLSALRRWH